ncbi:MFS transporter [Actinomadura sp. DC4]|uniref:MFS transporter n=1 Tax=Actinomadura sp. DC4 TaxID=3055069 RepID=UPI0025B279DB|nr:MFS transporter [Actinomadura sp. DC4]MDN3354368.1 MFS transporter [Actinomadura sp. DC4]
MSDTEEQEASAGAGSVAVLALASAAYSLAQTAVLPGLGTLSHALNASTADVSWVMSGYLLSAAILTPVFGRLGDMLGKRRMLVAALAIFALGSVVAALSTDIWMLVAARVVQGAGGGIIPLCLGIISDGFPARRRPAALGLVSAIAGIGAGGGLLMGGLLMDHATWQWIFWSGAITAGLAALGALRLPESGTRTPGRIDVGGILLLAVGLIAPLFALTRTSTWGWGDARTLGLIVAGLVVLTVFVFYERRVAEPLVDMSVLGRPVVLVTNLTTLLFGFGMFGAFVLIPQLAQTPKAAGYGFGLDATGAGLMLLPACLMMLVAAGVAGRIGVRVGSKIPLSIGALVAAAGLAVLALQHGSQGAVIGWSMVLFAGIGLGMAGMPNLIVDAIPRDKTGEGTAVNALVRSVGSSLGSQVVATLLAGSVTVAHPLPTDGAYGDAFWLGAGAIAVAAIASLLIPRASVPDRAPLTAGEEPAPQGQETFG